MKYDLSSSSAPQNERDLTSYFATLNFVIVYYITIFNNFS